MAVVDLKRAKRAKRMPRNLLPHLELVWVALGARRERSRQLP